MSRNNILNEYIMKRYDNKEEIYSEIFAKIQHKKYVRNKIINTAAVLFVIMMFGMVGTSSIYAKKNWEKDYKEYQERTIKKSNVEIDNIQENGYTENLNMDYIYQEGLGIKIDSLLITDDSYSMRLNFDIIDEEKKKFDTFEFGYVIYDENNTIYDMSERTTFSSSVTTDYKKKLCKELKIEYNPSKNEPKQLGATQNIVQNISEDGKVLKTITLQSFEGFPRSKKIYVRIFNIGYSLANYEKTSNSTILEVVESEDFKLYDGEWQFEINVPEKFYNRELIEFKMEKNVEGFEIEKAILTNTGFILNIKHKYPIINMNPDTINIIDEYGNKYNSSAGMSDDYVIKQVFSNISKENKELYLELNIPEHNIYEKIKLVSK